MTFDKASEDYFRWFYDTGVWKDMHYRGVRTLKVPSDMWSYQEILHERGIEWVVETGTRHGGSALYFADVLSGNGAAGRVISIDIDRDSRMIESHPRIDFIIGDSSAESTVETVRRMLPQGRGPLFLILDSEHTREHVLRELHAFLPLLQSGDYLVVEDTCVNGHPVRPSFGPGPYEALHEFMAQHGEKFARDEMRERKFGFTAAPGGYLIRR